MRRLILLPLVLLVPALFAAYTYYYTDTLTWIDLTKWGQNGTLTATPAGLTSADANGGSLISTVAVPDGSYDYEVKTTLGLTAWGGTFVQYLHASPDARSGPSPSGSYYSVELSGATPSGGATLTATRAAGSRGLAGA